MDMPDNGCLDCSVCRESFLKTICGITGNEVSGNHERGGFPEECTLKPIPEKMHCPPMNGANYEAGWNACIEAIVGDDSVKDG